MVRTGAVVSYAGQNEVAIEQRSTRDLAAGEILLRVRASGLCGTDLYKLQHDSIPAGTVLGHEIVAEVEELGTSVSGIAAGERVVVPHHVGCGSCAFCLSGAAPHCSMFRDNLLDPGGFSEFVIVRERAVREAIYRFSPSIQDRTAVFLEPAACVVRGIRRSGLFEDDRAEPARTAVVAGAGSMGLLHLLVLKAMDPSTVVIASDPDEGRRQLALSLGADEAVPPEALFAAVNRKTGEVGADVIFDTAGRTDSLDGEAMLLRGGGTVVFFAHGPDGARASFDFNAFFKQEGRLIATYSSSLHDQKVAFDLIESGLLDPSPLVTHVLPLSQFQRAVDLCRQRQALKVLLVPDGDA